MKRTPFRSAFTETFNSLNKNLKDSRKNVSVIEQQFDIVDKGTRKRITDDEIFNFMVTNGISENIIQNNSMLVKNIMKN